MITLDVAFCLDFTGSMSAWIAAAKQQILTITKDIAPRIQELHLDLKLEIKFSLVGFRDYGDSDQLLRFPADSFFGRQRGLQNACAEPGCKGRGGRP